jgi:hypothetical protein
VSYLHDHRGVIDLVAAGLAGIATISFLQGLALVVTILAGLGSLSLAGMRGYDRIKYGVPKGD